MKAIYTIILLLTLSVLAGCEKDTFLEMNLRNGPILRVASLSGYGDFTYENDLLKSAGDVKYIYNETEIVGYRSSVWRFFNLSGDQLPPYGDYINRYSIKEVDENSFLIIADSIWVYSIPHTRYDIPRVTYSLETNKPVRLLEFDGDKLIRCKFLYDKDAALDASLTEYRVEYNYAGNVAKVIEYHTINYSLFGSDSTERNDYTIEIEYEKYDNAHNPYHMISSDVRYISKFNLYTALSKNNPLRITRKSYFAKTPIKYSVDLEYEYGIKGYPTKIYHYKGESNEHVVTVTYE